MTCFPTTRLLHERHPWVMTNILKLTYQVFYPDLLDNIDKLIIEDSLTTQEKYSFCLKSKEPFHKIWIVKNFGLILDFVSLDDLAKTLCMISDFDLIVKEALSKDLEAITLIAYRKAGDTFLQALFCIYEKFLADPSQEIEKVALRSLISVINQSACWPENLWSYIDTLLQQNAIKTTVFAIELMSQLCQIPSFNHSYIISKIKLLSKNTKHEIRSSVLSLAGFYAVQADEEEVRTLIVR